MRRAAFERVAARLEFIARVFALEGSSLPADAKWARPGGEGASAESRASQGLREAGWRAGDETTGVPRAYREMRPKDVGALAAGAALEKLCGGKEGLTARGAAHGVALACRIPR